MYRPAVLLAVAVMMIASAATAQPAPRDTVEAIASRIEDFYFSPERGVAIAADLRAEAEAGRYDGLTDPDALARALTARLRPVDGHFHVEWSDGPVAAAQPADPPRLSWEARLARQAMGFPQVEVLPGNVGYVRISGFAMLDFRDRSDAAWRAADAALALTAGADAMIIDLRDNGGGEPSMVGYLISAFTAPDAAIYNLFHSREGVESEAPAVFHPAPRTAIPLYILTNGRTGSAAESFAYTLQAAGRATVVGEHTAGAANPGEPLDVPGGFSVFVPDGTPINPLTGGNWEGVGVAPDAPTASGDALVRAHALALERVLPGVSGPMAADVRRALQRLDQMTGG